MSEKLTRWLMFSVLIALLPIVFTYIHLLTMGKVSLITPLARGELLLISGALAADAIGDLIASGRKYVHHQICAGGGCLITVGFSSLYFADVSPGTASDPEVVFWVSVSVFFISLVASGSCKVLAERTAL